MFNLRKKEVLDREALWKDWEITPEQVIDLQALVGDSVDNVPGVPGIGLKTAAKLLQEFGTLENVLANIDRIPGAKKQESLRASSASVLLSRQLVRLATDVPLELDWESWRLRDWDRDRLLKLFQEWGFRGFAERVRLVSGGPPAEVSAPAVQGELFPFGANVEPEQNGHSGVGEHHYHLVDTPAKFKAFYAQLRRQEPI